VIAGLGALLLTLGGCAGAGYRHASRLDDRADLDPNNQQQAAPAPVGTTAQQFEFLEIYQEGRTPGFFPIDGIAGLAYANDGTLIVCDEQAGRVIARDARDGSWYEFDNPGYRPYRPVGVQVDGFAVFVLDLGGRMLLRFDLNGVYQNRLLDFERLDPAYNTVPSSFAIDFDGRLAVTDVGEQGVLLLDSFLNLTARNGVPGSHREQFDDPSGVVFLPDGGFLVTDRGNRRLQQFGRRGYFVAEIGGEFDLDNPFITPQGVGCDRFGNVFVADPAAGVVHVLDRRLAPAAAVGPDQGLAGTLEAPIDVALGPDNLLAVADRGRAAILVYRVWYE